jgi:hypothetical protein
VITHSTGFPLKERGDAGNIKSISLGKRMEEQFALHFVDGTTEIPVLSRNLKEPEISSSSMKAGGLLHFVSSWNCPSLKSIEFLNIHQMYIKKATLIQSATGLEFHPMFPFLRFCLCHFILSSSSFFDDHGRSAFGSALNHYFIQQRLSC